MTACLHVLTTAFLEAAADLLFQGLLQHLEAVDVSLGVEVELHHSVVLDVDSAHRANVVAGNGVGSSDLAKKESGLG